MFKLAHIKEVSRLDIAPRDKKANLRQEVPIRKFDAHCPWLKIHLLKAEISFNH